MGVCVSPFTTEIGRKKMDLPCGKCYECRARRVSGWAYRLEKEAEVSSSALFITLTYSDENQPITGNGYGTIVKSDVQKFIKRLRKKNNEKLKYYACGEYGSKTDRPHYHIIMFNCNSNTILNAWKYGHIHIGNVTPKSVTYTLKYLHKTGKIPMFELDDREPEFQLMSKGLGKSYLTDKMIKWHRDDMYNRMYIQKKGGQKISIPRYFKEKIYSIEERKRIGKYLINKALQEDDENQGKKRIEQHRKRLRKSKNNESI